MLRTRSDNFFPRRGNFAGCNGNLKIRNGDFRSRYGNLNIQIPDEAVDVAMTDVEDTGALA